MSFLEVKNINVSYGFAKVIHDVSIEVNKGEFVFLVGRNGAGKTTLLKTICSLIKPSEGTIEYEGSDIIKSKTEDLALAGIRFVAQDKKVFSDLTVRENLELAAHAVQEDLETTIKRSVNLYPQLEGFMDLKAGRLSGGQKEILLIARALVGKPKLILIDEPTEGLALIVIEEIIRLLETMKGDLTCIVVEQNLKLVQRMADTVYIMKEGKVIQKVVDKDEIPAIEKYL